MNDVVNAPAATEQTTMESLAAAIPSPQTTEGAATPTPAAAQATNAPAGDNVADFQKFVDSTQQATDGLKKQMEDLQSNQTELENSLHREAVNKAVDDAVKAINDNVDGDPEMAEFFLSKAYNNDPNLQKIFQSRDQFPEQYQKALDMLHTEWASKQNVKIDPQVAENQRALKDSQTPGTTPQKDDPNEKLAAMSDAEFFAHGMNLANNR